MDNRAGIQMCDYCNISGSFVKSLEEATKMNVVIDCIRFWYDSCCGERHAFCKGLRRR